jgi:hypothetical protein
LKLAGIEKGVSTRLRFSLVHFDAHAKSLGIRLPCRNYYSPVIFAMQRLFKAKEHGLKTGLGIKAWNESHLDSHALFGPRPR